MRLWAYAGIFSASLSGVSSALLGKEDTSTAAILSFSRKLPSCALQCFLTVLSDSECASTDLLCLCTDTKFDHAASECLLSNCKTQEVLAATRITNNVCGYPVHDKTEVTRVVQWCLFVSAVIVVTARFLARTPALGGQGYGWDDWTILLCLTLLVALNILLNKMLELGLGKEMWRLDTEQINDIFFYIFVEEFLYFAIVLGTKISILLVYLRLFPETERWLRIACLGLIWVTGITFIPVFFTILFQCDPIDFAWSGWDSTRPGHCIDTIAYIIAFAGINITLDLVVFLLPIPRLSKLDLSMSKKVGVVGVFLVGLFVTVCSVVRLQELLHWGTRSSSLWDFDSPATWSDVECSMSVVCACLPPLVGPFKRFWKRTIRRRSTPSESNLDVRHLSSNSVLDEINYYIRNEPGSKMSSRVVLDCRGPDSTDEFELIDKDRISIEKSNSDKTGSDQHMPGIAV